MLQFFHLFLFNFLVVRLIKWLRFDCVEVAIKQMDQMCNSDKSFKTLYIELKLLDQALDNFQILYKFVDFIYSITSNLI
jgi:hypothetical protein